MARPRIPIDKLPVIGTSFEAGTLVRHFRKGRHAHAEFACRHCGKHATCELSKLEKGTRKSCKCKRNANFMSYLKRGAAMLSACRAAKLAEAVEMAGSQGLTVVAARTGVSRAHLSVVWRIEREKAVSEVPASTMASALTIAQVRGFHQAAAATGIAVWIVMAAVRMQRSAARALAAAKANFAATDAVIAEAVEVAEAHLQALQQDPERYDRATFDRKELPAASKGTGVIWKTYRALVAAGDAIPQTLRPIADAFVNKVNFTRKMRKLASDNFNRERWWKQHHESFGLAFTA